MKRETLALLYHNIKTETTIFPSLRPGTESQQSEILQEFWTCFGDASVLMSAGGVSEYTVVRDNYRFYSRFGWVYGRTEGVHRVYLLFANDSLASEPAQIASEALRSIKVSIGAQ